MNKKNHIPNLDYMLLNEAIARIKQPGYRPTDDINAFWQKYRLQEAFSRAFELLLHVKEQQSNTPFSTWNFEEYVNDLMAFIIGSYFHSLPMEVFEKGEIAIDPEISFVSDPLLPTDEYDMILKNLFETY